MVNTNSTALNKPTDHNAPQMNQQARVPESRPWRQWHSASQAQESLPLEVSSPKKPQWGRMIYLAIIIAIVALVGGELIGNALWYQAKGTVSGKQYKVAPSQTVSIKDVLISPSDEVTAGQTLATLDSPELVQALARNEAEISRLQSDLVDSNTRRSADKEVLKASITRYRAEFETLRNRYARESDQIDAVKKLVEAGAASESSLRALELEHSETWSEYARVKAELESAQRQLATINRLTPGASAAGESEKRLASLTELRVSIQDQLNNLELRAPADGVVAQVPVSKGDILKAGEPAVVLLENKEVRAYLYFPASAQGKLQKGEIIDASTRSGEDFQLEVVKIYPAMESPAAENIDSEAIDKAAIVVEAKPADADVFPQSLQSGTPIYSKLPRWQVSDSIEGQWQNLKQRIKSWVEPAVSRIATR